jgi:HK97 family phage major capsid protein
VRGVTIRADEQAHRFGKFIHALFGNERAQLWCAERGIAIKAAQNEGVNSQGGALVPDEWPNTIINLKETFGVASRECAKVDMISDDTHWPRRTGGVNAFFVSEGVAPTESTATFDDVVLSAKKMAALVREPARPRAATADRAR